MDIFTSGILFFIFVQLPPLGCCINNNTQNKYILSMRSPEERERAIKKLFCSQSIWILVTLSLL